MYLKRRGGCGIQVDVDVTHDYSFRLWHLSLRFVFVLLAHTFIQRPREEVMFQVVSPDMCPFLPSLSLLKAKRCIAALAEEARETLVDEPANPHSKTITTLPLSGGRGGKKKRNDMIRQRHVTWVTSSVVRSRGEFSTTYAQDFCSVVILLQTSSLKLQFHTRNMQHCLII